MFRLYMLFLICVSCLVNPTIVFCANNSGVLRFVTQDFRPFSYVENGSVQGPFKECIEAICAEANIKCTYELLPWGRAQENVRRGKAEALFPIGWNAERATWLRSSPPLIRTEYGFFSNIHSGLQYRTVADLDGHTVAVYGPSNTSHQLHSLWKSRGGFRIDMRPDDEAGFNKLERGRVDFVFSNREAGEAIIRNLQLRFAEFSGAYMPVEYVVGFTKTKEKQSIIDVFLTAMGKLEQQGELDIILRRARLIPAK